MALEKNRYTQSYNDQKWSKSKFYAVRFLGIPRFLVSAGLNTEFDFNGNKLFKLGDPRTTSELITVNTIPEKDTCLFVFQWTSENTHFKQFIHSLDKIPDERKGNYLTSFSLEYFENLYISPDWWDSLCNDKRELVEKLANLTGPSQGQFYKNHHDFGEWEVQQTIENCL